MDESEMNENKKNWAIPYLSLGVYIYRNVHIVFARWSINFTTFQFVLIWKNQKTINFENVWTLEVINGFRFAAKHRCPAIFAVYARSIFLSLLHSLTIHSHLFCSVVIIFAGVSLFVSMFGVRVHVSNHWPPLCFTLLHLVRLVLYTLHLPVTHFQPIFSFHFHLCYLMFQRISDRLFSQLNIFVCVNVLVFSPSVYFASKNEFWNWK